MQLRDVVRDIMAHAPATMVLASATLAGWEHLPAWWRGRGTEPAKRAIVTQVGGGRGGVGCGGVRCMKQMAGHAAWVLQQSSVRGERGHFCCCMACDSTDPSKSSRIGTTYVLGASVMQAPFGWSPPKML